MYIHRCKFKRYMINYFRTQHPNNSSSCCYVGTGRSERGAAQLAELPEPALLGALGGAPLCTELGTAVFRLLSASGFESNSILSSSSFRHNSSLSCSCCCSLQQTENTHILHYCTSFSSYMCVQVSVGQLKREHTIAYPFALLHIPLQLYI